MLELLLRRCLQAVPLLVILSIVTFAAVLSLPGDPVDVLVGNAQKDMAPEEIQLLREEFGLNKSPAEQYLLWLSNGVMKGNLGRSYKDGRPVVSIIRERLPSTVRLVATALLLAFGLGVAWGLSMVALKQSKAGKWAEAGLFVFALILYSAPGFWIGFLALTAVGRVNFLSDVPLLAVHAAGQATPTSAASVACFGYVLLPACVLSLRRMAKIALFVRTATLNELSQEYVTTALGKGLSRIRVLTKHVLRNSLAPIISLAGLSLPSLLGGSVLIETVFAWPGMGRLAVESTFGRDYPMILALVMMYGALVIFSNLAADILELLTDPRRREAYLSEVEGARN
ncbi:MAG: ABC transporter permease [Candidatus Melainabacteria bacterium]|nr:ABC transporter permease [Candidatus Melainabacteria bacterium]